MSNPKISFRMDGATVEKLERLKAHIQQVFDRAGIPRKASRNDAIGMAIEIGERMTRPAADGKPEMMAFSRPLLMARLSEIMAVHVAEAVRQRELFPDGSGAETRINVEALERELAEMQMRALD